MVEFEIDDLIDILNKNKAEEAAEILKGSKPPLATAGKIRPQNLNSSVRVDANINPAKPIPRVQEDLPRD